MNSYTSRWKRIVRRLGLSVAPLALLLAAIPAFSQTVYSYTTLLSQAGAQTYSGGYFYVIPATAPITSCNGAIYIPIGTPPDATSTVASVEYSAALSALASGLTVRIDYQVGSNGICDALLLAVN